MVGNKRVFEVEVDGKTQSFAVVRPTHKVAQEGTLVYNRAFRQAVTPADGKPGALVRDRVEAVLREQNLWDDAKQAEYEEAVKAIRDGELKLSKGGIKLSEARDAAIAVRVARAKIQRLVVDRNAYDAVTAEAQAEQARFDYFVSACTVYPDGKPYFKSMDDMLSREDDPVVLAASRTMAALVGGLSDDWEKKLFENAFLQKYKLCDENLRLIDKDGNFVDARGRRVDERGHLLNDKGEPVDADGNPLTEDGDYKVEFVEFEDDVFGRPTPVEDAAAV